MGFRNVIERIRRKRERTAVDKTIELSARVKQVEGAISPETGLLGESAVEFEHHLTPTEMIGHRIGARYEILEVKEGGMGFVYKCCDHELNRICAVKTFKDEFLTSVFSHVRFHREALAWVELDKHPAYSKGLVCHRDIKPGNILIDANGNVKITDFGIAKTFDSMEIEGMPLFLQEGYFGIYLTKTGRIFGSPFWMSPEQFEIARNADQRSDSFGVVLFQMANRGELPFWTQPPQNDPKKDIEKFFRKLYQLHKEEKVPRINTPLFPIIERCMEKDPEERYSSFSELRKDLEDLLHSEYTLLKSHASELCNWNPNLGVCYAEFGEKEKAIEMYRQAQKINPDRPLAFINEADVLIGMRQFDDALQCVEHVLSLDSRFAGAWEMKGAILIQIGDYQQALTALNNALKFDPFNSDTWKRRGDVYRKMTHWQDALKNYNQALQLDKNDAKAMDSISFILYKQGKLKEALKWPERAVRTDPNDPECWVGMGLVLRTLGRLFEALDCYNRAIEIDHNHAPAYSGKGTTLLMIKDVEGAKENYMKFVRLAEGDPGMKDNVEAMKGLLRNMGVEA